MPKLMASGITQKSQFGLAEHPADQHSRAIARGVERSAWGVGAGAGGSIWRHLYNDTACARRVPPHRAQRHQSATRAKEKDTKMNYHTATLEQLRKERVRLTNMQQMLQQRLASTGSSRGGRNAGYRSGATNYQQEREMQRLMTQIAELDAELVRRDQQAQPANTDTVSVDPAGDDTTAAPEA